MNKYFIGFVYNNEGGIVFGNTIIDVEGKVSAFEHTKNISNMIAAELGIESVTIISITLL